MNTNLTMNVDRRCSTRSPPPTPSASINRSIKPNPFTELHQKPIIGSVDHRLAIPAYPIRSKVVMADVVSSSEASTSVCSHCERSIPAANIDLHFAHCSRNLEKCKVCGDMIPKKFAEEHYMSTHSPVECSLCSETVDREILAVHEGENCPRRITTCEFCEFPLPAVDLVEHQEVCGNRTELCHLCNKYIRLRERNGHEIRCSIAPKTTAEPSRRETRPAERERRAPPPRRRADEFSTGRLVFTVAITGIAVLLGSFIFLRQTGKDEM